MALLYCASCASYSTLTASSLFYYWSNEAYYMAPDLVDRRTLSSTGFHSVYIVAIWRLSNPRLVNLAITGASISLLIASIGQTLGTSRRLSLSVQGQAVPLPS